MLHRQLRSALEEIFGEAFVAESLLQSDIAQRIIHDEPDRFKQTIRGFQRLNYRDEQSAYADSLEPEYGYALICSLLDNPTRELIVELGMNYL